MKKFTLNLIIVATVATLFFSCSGLGKVVKSGDPELIYQTALKLYRAEKWTRASDMFEACQGYYVGSEREDSIAFFSARSKFKDRDYHEASLGFDEFRRKFGRSAFIEDAEGMYALCEYYMAPEPSRDQTLTAKAIVSLNNFMERYPDSERNEAFRGIIEELTGRLHEKNFLNAYAYFKTEKYKSAVVAFRNALKNYDETPYREQIMYYIVVSNYRLAHNSVAEKQADRYLSMLDSYYSFIEEFKESKHSKELARYFKEAKDFIDKNKQNEESTQTE
ncbi:MAG: outer membrane protein assembly factor BamD [Alistipes sp.]|nr:outer membrane protein assembly factor BamD [Alistipes sp.]